MVAVFIMSATLALLRIKLFTNKCCDVTIFGEDKHFFGIFEYDGTNFTIDHFKADFHYTSFLFHK